MRARLVGGLLTVLALGLVGGCKAHEGQKVVGYSGRTNNWVKAPDDGTYSLRGARGQSVTYFVQKGERIGFRKSGGAVVAIAGDNAPVELERGTARQAYWKFNKKEEATKGR
jgi:hypothetical protein